MWSYLITPYTKIKKKNIYLVYKYICTMILGITKRLVGVSKRDNSLKLMIKGNNRIFEDFYVISKLYHSLRDEINFSKWGR